MSNGKFIPPTQKGTELFPQTNQPPVVRIHGVENEADAARLWDKHKGRIGQFQVQAAHNASLITSEYSKVRRNYPGLSMSYAVIQGTEYIDVYVAEPKPKNPKPEKTGPRPWWAVIEIALPDGAGASITAAAHMTTGPQQAAWVYSAGLNEDHDETILTPQLLFAGTVVPDAEQVSSDGRLLTSLRLDLRPYDNLPIVAFDIYAKVHTDPGYEAYISDWVSVEDPATAHPGATVADIEALFPAGVSPLYKWYTPNRTNGEPVYEGDTLEAAWAASVEVNEFDVHGVLVYKVTAWSNNDPSGPLGNHGRYNEGGYPLMDPSWSPEGYWYGVSPNEFNLYRYARFVWPQWFIATPIYDVQPGTQTHPSRPATIEGTLYASPEVDWGQSKVTQPSKTVAVPNAEWFVYSDGGFQYQRWEDMAIYPERQGRTKLDDIVLLATEDGSVPPEANNLPYLGRVTVDLEHWAMSFAPA